MKHAKRLARAVLFGAVLGCGTQPVTPAQPAKSAAPVAEVSAVAAPAAEPEPLPDDLAASLPAGIALLELVDVPAMLRGLHDTTTGEPLDDSLIDAGVAALAAGAKLPPSEAIRAFRSLQSASLMVMSVRDKGFGACLRVDDAEPIDQLLRIVGRPADTVARGGQRFGLVKPRTSEPIPDAPAVLWYRGSRVLATGDAAFLDAVTDVVAGRRPALTSKANMMAARRSTSARLRLVGDVAAALPESLPIRDALFADGDPLLITASWEPAASLVIEQRLSGTAIVGAPPAPATLDLAGRLPAQTVAWIAYSTRSDQPADERFQDLIAALSAFDPKAKSLSAVLPLTLGLSGGELFGALGDQGVVGVMLAPDAAEQIAKKRPKEAAAAVLVQELANEAAAKKLEPLLDAAQKNLAPKFRVTRTARGLSADPLQPKDEVVSLAVRFVGKRVVVAVGAKKLVDQALAAVEKGKDTLGAKAPTAAAGTRTEIALRLGPMLPVWRKLAEDQPSSINIDKLAKLAQNDPALVRYTSRADGNGVRARVEMGLGGVAVAGAGAALAIYGVRRYLATAKTAGAKSNVVAIRRAAQAAFEREWQGPQGAVHALCNGADPVPASIPSGTKYLPSSEPGRDYDRGDDAGGWKCLRFALVAPQYYRYSYHVGGGYLGPSRGLPDPGPNGFEVAAEGDLDADGTTSLFTAIGSVDPASGELRAGPMVYISNEYE